MLYKKGMYAFERIIYPLDTNDIRAALREVKRIKGYVGIFKLGLELHYAMHAATFTDGDEEEALEAFRLCRELYRELDGRFFVDAKLDDIPTTVNGAAKQISRMHPLMFNVHASAGRESVAKAVARKGKAKVLGVTVLTSISPEECISIFGAEPGEKVLQFARMLIEVGADGIICSPQELKFLARYPEFDILIKVTPGVRPAGAGVQDQKRVMTPGEAIENGADYLVIGRPISAAPDPVLAARRIAKEISAAIAKKRAMEIFAERNAIIKNSHIVYKAGEHGSEYVNKDEIFVDPEATDEICQFIAEQYQDIAIDAVIGPATGGISLSQGIARHLTRLSGRTVLSIYADQEGENLAIKRGYGKYLKAVRVLVVDDVFTTGGSVKKLIALVVAAGGIVVGIGGICDRGGVSAQGFGEGLPSLYTLVVVNMAKYAPGDCPFCKAGVDINIEVGHGRQFIEQKFDGG